MKNGYFIDGWDERFPTLHAAKEHVNDSFTEEEKKRDFSGGGHIYHVVNEEVAGGVSFEYKNGKINFHKS